MSKHFTMTIPIEASATEVYRAIADRDGPSNWWTRFAQGADQVGQIAEFPFPQAGFYAAMKVRKLEPERLVEWECVEQVHNKNTGWSDLHDWEGTTLRFEVEPLDDDSSRLRFEHVGLAPVLECYETCDSSWRYYLGESLKEYVERGEGKPFADDSEDNIQRRGGRAE